MVVVLVGLGIAVAVIVVLLVTVDGLVRHKRLDRSTGSLQKVNDSIRLGYGLNIFGN